MTAHTRFSLALVVLLAGVLACSAPSVQPSPVPAPTDLPATETPIATPTIAPTPAIDAGWDAYHDDTLKLTLARPAGWEVTAVDADTLEIHQADDDGWMQLDVVSGTGNNLFALSYAPGMGGDAVVAALLAAARQDGAYADPQPIPTRSERPAWISEGRSDVHDEQTLIGAIGLADRALVFVGHGSDKPEDWTALSAVYRGVIASLEDR